MMTFIMTAECMPRDSANWFDGFKESAEFQAKSFEAAQEWLDEQCAKAGTDADAHYDSYGPLAVHVEHVA